MQMIFQDPFGSLNPRRTVADTLRQTIRIHHLASNRVDEVAMIYRTLEEVELRPPDQFADKFPALLSGGQLQRVSIGRVLVLQPSFVIADESVSMLDVSVRIGILDLLTRMRDKFGISFIYITHDLVTARYICDRIAIMYLGKIVEIGPAEEIVHNPLHPYTQALIAAVPDPDPSAELEALPIRGYVPVSQNDDLCYLSAHEALDLFKKRRLSPVELLTALVERAEKVEPHINAFSSRRFDIAMDQAKAAETVYGQISAIPRPLEGIPVGLNYESSLKGDNTTEGSLILKDTVDTYDHPMVQHLIASGAIIHARTNVPEFCCAAFTASRLHGVSASPWNTALSCGGSSGGSGASLAAGTSTLATGSDIGGSIRIPACFNGVVGRTYDDVSVFQLGKNYERIADWEAHRPLL